MATSARRFFEKVFDYDASGTTYNDRTIEAESILGTSFTVLGATADYLYLGNSERFDLMIFDVDTAGSLGALTYEYYSTADSAYRQFVPTSGRAVIDPDDAPGTQYDFSEDGYEGLPNTVHSDWSTVAVNSVTLYWIRIRSAASVSQAPTIKNIRMRPVNAYCTSKEIYYFLNLPAILGGTDFTTSTTPTKYEVESLIESGQSKIDQITQKSWRPNYVESEFHEFNLNGFKLDRPDPFRVYNLEIWSGTGWEAKTRGRTNDFFFISDTGMIQFARYFILPARVTSYTASSGRWGGGEFVYPVKVNYA